MMYAIESTDNKVPGIKGVNAAGGTGVWGESSNQGGRPTWLGVYGKSSSTIGGAGVYAENWVGPGVTGVFGTSPGRGRMGPEQVSHLVAFAWGCLHNVQFQKGEQI
jgi:hypothetical protein